MWKLPVAVLAVALPGNAAAGWRGLRVDGSSEAAFAKSLEEFKEKLSPAHRYVLGEALKDIWLQGEKQAEADQREFTDRDYYARLHGLSYKEIARRLNRSFSTVDHQLRSVREKLGVRSAGQLVRVLAAHATASASARPPNEAAGM